MSNWRVAIPSYKRAARLRDTTLNLLKKQDISRERIDVFVADAEEHALYLATLDPATYGNLIIAVPGMGAVRNFMTDYYEEGQPILYIDDDIIDLLTLDPSFNLTHFVDQAFATCIRDRLRLFGIYPVANKFFMRSRTTDGLTYIVGCFYGVLNNRSIRVTLDDKEDFQRTILYYLADGGVLRYGWVAPVTRYYKTPGGMQVLRTMQRILESAQYLYDTYPDLCRLNMKKKSGHPEVRLLRLKRRPV